MGGMDGLAGAVTTASSGPRWVWSRRPAARDWSVLLDATVSWAV
jgi:hypothetical protein